MGIKVSVDKETCIGCGSCVTLCPDVFEMIDGKSSVKKPELEEIGCSQSAADACPVQCIKVIKE